MKQTQKERLAYFQALYENAKHAYSDTLLHLERQYEQYLGSKALDGAHEGATLVRNITYEIIESQVSSEIPQPKVSPLWYSERRDRLAQSIERLCIAERDRLPFEKMNDLDERYTYIYGSSIFFVEWDSEGRDGGGVKVSCLSPRNFIPEPNVNKVEDMDYCFLRFLTTKRDISRRYSISEGDLSHLTLEHDTPDSYTASAEEDEAVTLVVAFYRTEDGEVGQFVFSGDLILCDLPNYYARKRRVCTGCHEGEGECECENPTFVLDDEGDEEIYLSFTSRDAGIPEVHFSEDMPLGEGAWGVEKIRVPYFRIRSFPIVIRKNTSREGSLYGQSDCEFLRPQQQAINKVESRILQKLLRAGITPIVPEDATITLNNSVFGQLIKMKPGESASQYGTVDTTPNISQDIAEAERLYLHAKRILGISDAYVGIGDYKNESGYARQLQISQASGRLESKRKMKHTAYAMIDRLIFEHTLAFSDNRQNLAYRDAYGRIHDATFHRYDFLRYDAQSKGYTFDTDFLFSVDQSGAIEGQRDALWEKNLENLRTGALGALDNPETLLRYWQLQERAHYPYARDNVEYFAEQLRQKGEMSENEISRSEELP